HCHIAGIDQTPNRFSDLSRRNLVTLRQHPYEFAERRNRDRDEFGFLQRRLCNLALFCVVVGDGPDQDISVGSNLHRLPAQPRAAILFISSIDSDERPCRFKMPKASAILPVGRAAVTSIRPFGSLFTVIFSPGCTPRCSSTSLRKVTWPLAVTVSVVISGLRFPATVRQ